MARKSALGKLQDTLVGTVRGVAQDPVGTARSAVGLGRAVAGEVAGQVSRVVRSRTGRGSTPPPSAPAPVRQPEATTPSTPPASPPTSGPKPSDLARVVEKKPAAAKKAPAKKTPAKKPAATKAAPAKKSTPSGKLPPKKKAD